MKIKQFDVEKIGFPRMVSFKEERFCQSEILMELLGPSINKETFSNPQRFTVEHSLEITLKLLDLV